VVAVLGAGWYICDCVLPEPHRRGTSLYAHPSLAFRTQQLGNHWHATQYITAQ
jgi:hypothetical protein